MAGVSRLSASKSVYCADKTLQVRRFSEIDDLGKDVIGGQFGIADIAVMSNLINYQYLGHRVEPGRFPRLARYLETHLARPTIGAALAAERMVAEGMGLDRSFVTDLAAA